MIVDVLFAKIEQRLGFAAVQFKIRVYVISVEYAESCCERFVFTPDISGVLVVILDCQYCAVTPISLCNFSQECCKRRFTAAIATVNDVKAREVSISWLLPVLKMR